MKSPFGTKIPKLADQPRLTVGGISAKLTSGISTKVALHKNSGFQQLTRIKIYLRTEFLKLGDRTIFVTG